MPDIPESEPRPGIRSLFDTVAAPVQSVEHGPHALRPFGDRLRLPAYEELQRLVEYGVGMVETAHWNYAD
jgi:hypothetical protein